MTQPKQNTNPKPKNRMGRFRAIIGKLAKLFGILFVVLLIIYLVFYYVFWPRNDRQRFAEAEQLVEKDIVSLGVRAEDIQKAYTCARDGQKYIPGIPWCYFEYSFNVSDTQTKEDVFGAFGDEFDMTLYPKEKPDIASGYFGVAEFGCVIQSPQRPTKYGPPDMYTVRCSSYVTRYIYN